MKILLILMVLFALVGCSKNGEPCVDWRVKPGCDSLVAAYVKGTLSTILVTQRPENEAWDEFEHQAFEDAVKLYGYFAQGTDFREGERWICVCEQDRATNAQQAKPANK